MLHSRYLFLCPHEEASLFLLLSIHIWLLHIIRYFFRQAEITFLIRWIIRLAFVSIFHLMLYVLLLSFNVQTYLLNSVEFLYLWCLKDELWLEYLALNCQAKIMFHRCWLLLRWPGRLLSRHLPSREHLVWSRQLQVLTGCWGVVFSCLFVVASDCWAHIVHT